MIDRIWRAAGLAWADLMQPTGAGTPPYTAASSALGHAVLGATAAALLGMGYGLPGALAIALAYWLAKERGDLRRQTRGFQGLGEDIMPDRFSAFVRGVTAPALGSFGITPSDAADLPQPVKAVTISGPGVIAWQDGDGAAQVTAALPQGTYPMFARRILATGTTATGLTGWV